MKIFTTSFLILITLIGLAQKSTIRIPPLNSIELDYVEYKRYSIELKNRSSENLEVVVVRKKNNEPISGFGLSPKGKEAVSIAMNTMLRLTNKTDSWIKVRLVPTEIDPINDAEFRKGYIDFTLRNETVKSIPLVIPGVMNPNLSPMSNSGVSLKQGQKVFFKHKNRKYLLFEVDEKILPRQIIKVGELVKKRKKELRLN